MERLSDSLEREWKTAAHSSHSGDDSLSHHWWALGMSAQNWLFLGTSRVKLYWGWDPRHWCQGEEWSAPAGLGGKHTDVGQQVFGFRYGPIRKSNIGARSDKINIKFWRIGACRMWPNSLFSVSCKQAAHSLACSTTPWVLQGQAVPTPQGNAALPGGVSLLNHGVQCGNHLLVCVVFFSLGFTGGKGDILIFCLPSYFSYPSI